MSVRGQEPQEAQQGDRIHQLARQPDVAGARTWHEPARVPDRLRDGRLRGRGRGRRLRHPARHRVRGDHPQQLRHGVLHRRLHGVLLRDQQRCQRLPAQHLRRRVVASRQFELLRRQHAVLHRLQSELLRPGVGLLPERLLLLPGMCGVPLSGWLRHAPGVLQLLPLRAVPHGDPNVGTHRVPGRHVCAAVHGRRATCA